jgi:phosphoheptose isomerase
VTRSANKKDQRRPMARMLTIREEIRYTSKACETASRQIRDDTVLQEAELSLESMQLAIKAFGTIWLCGGGSGHCLALEVAQKLATPLSKFERPTRAGVLGLNGAMLTTSYGKCGTDDALGAELMVHGRRNDALWCFAPDPTSRAILGVVTRANRELKIPVVVFTSYPGTPLIRFSSAKIQIQEASEDDRSGYCVQWAHSFLANIICSQLKRCARRARE